MIVYVSSEIVRRPTFAAGNSVFAQYVRPSIERV